MSSFLQKKSLTKLTEKLTIDHFKLEESFTSSGDIMSINIEIVHELLKNDPDPVTHYHRNDYDTIYTMSDIHADYKTFLTHLQNFGIIERANIDDIYNISNITDVKWKCGSRTLLVICGDIVDGKRGEREVKDEQGTYEILLHAFLRNLKISAQEKGSDVILLYGNHDVRMFNFRHMNIPKHLSLDDIQKFMHSNAQKLYNAYVDKKNIFIQHSNHIRAYILKPFYKQFTLFFGIENNNVFKTKFDMLFIHGGFHNHQLNPKDMLISIKNLQDNLMKNFDNDKVFQSIMKELSEPDSAMWTRYYTEGNFIEKQNPEECDKVENFPTVIVGHCRNSNHNYLQNDDDERPCTKNKNKYSMPNCIYPKCYTDKKTPKIINIDNILSSCYQYHNSELYEMLKIEKKGDEKKFSKFSSVFIKDGKVNEYNLVKAYQETSSPTKGGRTKHKRRRKSKKATKKRKRRSRNRR